MSENEYIGWDIGGAHLKMAHVDVGGTVINVEQHATPIWEGLDSLNSILIEVKARLPDLPLSHIITTTGELSDLFSNRQEGVDALLSEFDRVFTGGEILVYGGTAGLLSVSQAKQRYQLVASANWHATASYLARELRECILIDIGSTTTDMIVIKDGSVANRGYTDQERMIEDELLYTGLTRTPVMAVVSRVPIAGRWQSVAAELFATMADVYRITGELDEGHDLMPAADGGGKQVLDSRRRLARMIGCDLEDGESHNDYYQLAIYIAEEHIHRISRSLQRLLSTNLVSSRPHLVGAGVGRKLVAKLALRHDYEYTDIEHMIKASENQAAIAADCAAAVSVAQLARLAQ